MNVRGGVNANQKWSDKSQNNRKTSLKREVSEKNGLCFQKRRETVEKPL